ncbi:hypothetical protein BV25DRAFT_1832097 [Artomyces pyxidatus]|uniref:Uncharacterized protein n=1 Tax=Artomyces pyxidatus TaxID=48021 RepID=A0ACB8SKZ9_9AGAM|nr:hypothetical protein BV25DRAFT_1832097 [Artomyces pyxidatus]
MAGKNSSSSASKSSKSSSSSGGSSSTYTPKSNYAYHQSFGGYNNFMASYGLKPWDDDDVQEGNAILDAFREGDKYDHDQAQGKK